MEAEPGKVRTTPLKWASFEIVRIGIGPGGF